MFVWTLGGLFTGLWIGFVLKRTKLLNNWKQAIIIIIGWGLAQLTSRLLIFILNMNGISLDLTHWFGPITIGMIAGVIGGTVMYWQLKDHLM